MRRWVTQLAVALALALAGTGCREGEVSAPPIEPYTATASVSTNAIFIGEPLTLSLDVLHPAGSRVELPPLGRDPEIRIRGETSVTEPLNPDLACSRYQVQMTSFRTGTHVICTNAIAVLQDGAAPRSIPFPFQTVLVGSVLERDGPGAEAAGLKEPVHWPDRVPRWLIGLVVVGLAALAATLLVIRFRRDRPPPPPKIKPVTPAHEIALGALARLRGKGYIEQALFEPFYVEVSAIARLYLEQRFAVHAPELTTEEFIREAARHPQLSPPHQHQCAQFLEHCDLVKFARFEPQTAQMEDTLGAVEQLVRETTEQPAPGAAEEGAT